MMNNNNFGKSYYMKPPPLMHKLTWLACIVTLTIAISSFTTNEPSSPLSVYSSKWNDKKFAQCNTAAGVSYMTKAEKDVIYILNMARMDPILFNNTVVKQYPAKSGKLYIVNSEYYKSLVDTLSKVKPLRLLKPDSVAYVSAYCHALHSGAKAYVGHGRQSEECKSKTKFNGECCEYGHSEPLDIIMALLIDEGVPSLGHRDILLSSYSKIGVSIQPHNGYGSNTVLDFLF